MQFLEFYVDSWGQESLKGMSIFTFCTCYNKKIYKKIKNVENNSNSSSCKMDW
jgi:uroporphyrinogen-III decarboxylase